MVSLARKNLLHDRMRFAITLAGVAFAVTLVLVQVGLFMGLLAKATVTIEHANAELWVTSKETPNIDFAHTFPETRVLRVRGVPGVARADNLLVQFMNIQLPTGAEEGCLVYALDDFAAWNLPWNVHGADVADLKRGDYILMDRSAARRFGPFAVGEHREILQRRFKIVGTTEGAASFTTAPIVFMDFAKAQERLETLQGKAHYVLVALEPGADAAAVKAEIERRLPYNDVYTKAEWAARSRALLGGLDGPGHEHGHHCVPGRPGRDRGGRTDPLHVGRRAREGVRHGQGHRRLELGHLPDPGRAGPDRGGGWLRAGRRDLAGHAAG